MFLQIDLEADGFIEGLERFEEELDRTMPVVLGNALEAVASTARQLAPKGDTSQLAESIQALPVQGSWSAGSLTGFVEAGAPYAIVVEEGSRAHEIRAKFRRALRFPVEGGFVFRRRVMHPGTRPQPFLEPALRQEEADFLAEASAAVELAFRRAGF